MGRVPPPAAAAPPVPGNLRIAHPPGGESQDARGSRSAPAPDRGVRPARRDPPAASAAAEPVLKPADRDGATDHPQPGLPPASPGEGPCPWPASGFRSGRPPRRRRSDPASGGVPEGDAQVFYPQPLDARMD